MKLIYPPPSAVAGGLAAANNLSDLASAASARDNLEVLSEAETLQHLASRAPAPFLLFDGATSNRRAEMTPGAAGAVAGMPISIPFEFDVPTSNPSAGIQIASFNANGTASPTITAYGFSVLLQSTGALQVFQTGATFNDYRYLQYAGFRAAYSGLRVRGAVVFASPNTMTNPVIYTQGADISSSFALTTGGTAPNWMPTTLDTTKFLSGYNWSGRLVPHAPILGALTAAEVLAWTQTGLLPNWCYAGTGSAVVQTSGTLTIGRKYRIKTYVASDVFTNVGAASNATGVEFVATGTTPTTWTNSSELLTLGPIARHTLQPGATVHPDDGANKLPLLLTAGVTAVGSTPNEVVIPGPAMTADGFVHADQVITPSGYELVAAYALQTGTETSTITVKETSSGGTTVATGALSASVTRVALTVSNGLLAGGKKMHLANSSWAGNTVTPVFVFRRAS